MKYLILITSALCLLACKDPEQKQVDPVRQVPDPHSIPGQKIELDSPTYYRNFIQGRWFIPGDPNEALEIRQDQIDFGEGLLISPYRFHGWRQLILISKDGSADTVNIRAGGDTLFVKSGNDQKEAPYLRRP